MMEQIDRDVMRTHPDMHFFSGSDRKACMHREVGLLPRPIVALVAFCQASRARSLTLVACLGMNCTELLSNLPDGSAEVNLQLRRGIFLQEMKRVLFIFAKLNQGLRYVQGMNELLAPLYYQFKTDVSGSEQQFAEADSFYCFMDIIAEFRDHFCQQLVSLICWP